MRCSLISHVAHTQKVGGFAKPPASFIFSMVCSQSITAIYVVDVIVVENRSQQCTSSF